MKEHSSKTPVVHIWLLKLHGYNSIELGEPFSRAQRLRNHSRTSHNFMKPEGSLPRSQEPSTGPYPQPN
jgi:hypothetical protein